MRYPVTITPNDGQFTVTFPDVLEAVTFGETREEALRRAPNALLTIFDAFMADRRDIPAPSERRGDHVEVPALDATKIELYRTMRAANVGKSELARRLDWHLPQVDRVLNVRHASRIDQVEAAFDALGKKLEITVVDKDAPVERRIARIARQRATPRRPRIHAGVLVGVSGSRSVARKKR